MKACVFLLVVLVQPFLLPISGGLSGQEPVELEVNQFVFFVSPGQFKPLEHEVPVVPRSESLVKIEGNRSTVRFVQGEPLAFVIRLASDAGDPASAVQFLKLKAEGNYRVARRITASLIPFEVEGYDESSFKIKAKSALGGGEYALTLVGEKDVFCFGVDAPSKELK